jgi:hypothetical protein
MKYRYDYLDGVAHLLAVLALDLGPVLGLRAVTGEMAGLLAVAAQDLVRVLGLGAVLGHVVFAVAVAASALGDVRTLLYVNSCMTLKKLAD